MLGHDAASRRGGAILVVALPILLACAAPAGDQALLAQSNGAEARDRPGEAERGRDSAKQAKRDRRSEAEREEESRERGGRGPRIARGPAFADRRAVLEIGARGRPAYLGGFIEPEFGTRLVRIGGDTGAPIGAIPGRWGTDVRHAYSKQQPWSADGRLIAIQNRGGSPPLVFLDGDTFRPRSGGCEGSPLYDWRWHPDPRHARTMIGVNRAGTELVWYDVENCRVTRRWTLPVRVDYGVGSGEGNPSNDGRFVALGNDREMFVVDMDPRPPHAPYPSVRIGPVHRFAPCSVGVAGPDFTCGVDNLSMSASGRYVAVNVSVKADSMRDGWRIYDVDPKTLALLPRRMSDEALRCGSFAARPNGWILPLKHADLALDPFDGDQDVLVGARSCPGAKTGWVVKVRLKDGRATSLTDPRDESPAMHVSTRNLDRPGWAYVSYYRKPGRRFHDEVVAVRLDGSGEVERIAHLRSTTKGCYRCEPHAVPSRDGRFVMFASTWTEDCGGDCGDARDIKGYVVAVPGVRAARAGTPRASEAARANGGVSGR